MRGSVCSIALLLVCLDWKSDSFSYRTTSRWISKLQHYLLDDPYSSGNRRGRIVRVAERQKANSNSKKAWFLEFLNTFSRQEEPVTAQTTSSLVATHNNSLGQLWQCDFVFIKLYEETYIPTYGRYHRDENKGFFDYRPENHHSRLRQPGHA